MSHQVFDPWPAISLTSQRSGEHDNCLAVSILEKDRGRGGEGGGGAALPPCTESHQPMHVRSGLIRESPAQGSVSSPRSWPYEADLGIRSWQVVVREFSAAASQHSQALLIPKLQVYREQSNMVQHSLDHRSGSGYCSG